MAARWVGNVFNEGLYDVHIHLKKMHDRGVPRRCLHTVRRLRE
jgi:hypothetical protein